jgi:exosortase A-associated hydrolase 2
MTPSLRRPVFEPLFIDCPAGRIFAVHYPPRQAAPAGRGVVYLPPFAEELNRSRRMAALQARALAAAGCSALVLDPFGCGDSEGDFGDARWEIWQANAVAAVEFLLGRGCVEVTLLGLRAGAMLALAAAPLAAAVNRVIAWQPVLNGSQMITQFLRLRLASDMFAETASGEGTGDLRARLRSGAAVEVAGYRLPPALAAEIERQDFLELAGACRVPIEWVELVSDRDELPAPPRQTMVERLKSRGVQVTVHRVVGEAFWMLQDVAVVHPLIETTTGLLRGDVA